MVVRSFNTRTEMLEVVVVGETIGETDELDNIRVPSSFMVASVDLTASPLETATVVMVGNDHLGIPFPGGKVRPDLLIVSHLDVDIFTAPLDSFLIKVEPSVIGVQRKAIEVYLVSTVLPEC